MCLSFSALTSQYDPSNVFFLRVIHVHWTVVWYIQNPSVFRITLKVYLECDCPEDSPCYTNEFSALTQQHRILIYFSSWEYYMSDVHWHIHQCLTEFPTNGLNIFPFQIVLDDCGNSSFQLFFAPHTDRYMAKKKHCKCDKRDTIWKGKLLLPNGKRALS